MPASKHRGTIIVDFEATTLWEAGDKAKKINDLVTEHLSQIGKVEFTIVDRRDRKSVKGDTRTARMAKRSPRSAA